MTILHTGSPTRGTGTHGMRHARPVNACGGKFNARSVGCNTLFQGGLLRVDWAPAGNRARRRPVVGTTGGRPEHRG